MAANNIKKNTKLPLGDHLGPIDNCHKRIVVMEKSELRRLNEKIIPGKV